MPAPDDIIKIATSQTTRRRSDRYGDVERVRLVTTVPVVVVRVVATSNVAPTGSPTIDGVSIYGDFDTILLTAQTAPEENGTWHWQAGAWIRSDNPAGPGVMYSVLEGTTNEASVWLTRLSGSIELGFQL